MAESADRPVSSIYDLGYRPYDGPRLGRRHAIYALYVYSLGAVFGIGRSLLSKAFPIGLAILAQIPALVQLAIAALVPPELEYVAPEDYFGFVQVVLILFCAVVAPEIIGRDQRNRTLPLYFSRALSRVDYVSAKWLALAVALVGVLMLPQLILILGQAVANTDLLGYLGDNLDLLPPILASSAMVACYMAAVALAIASQTSKRAIATGAVLAYFVIFSALGSILVETTTEEIGRFVVLVSPANVLEGSVHWIFSSAPPEGSDVAKVDLADGFYFVAAVGYALAALAVLYRRFLRLAV
jgi:ABC-2 type transport system permease protein